MESDALAALAGTEYGGELYFGVIYLLPDQPQGPALSWTNAINAHYAMLNCRKAVVIFDRDQIHRSL